LRILFITNYYPPYEIGGYEQLCRDVAERLRARGHEVQVLTSRRGVGKGIPEDENGVRRVLHLQPDFEAPVSPAWQFLFWRRRLEAENLRALRALSSRFHPDLIFIWNLQGLPRSLAIEAEAMPEVAVAYWLAGYSPAAPDEFWLYWTQPAKQPALRPFKALAGKVALGLMRWEGKPLRPQMRHVAVVSEYERRKGIADGTLPTQTRVIYNGVEVDRFFRPVPTELQGPLNLLQAGRVSADKGVHVAVQAIGHLAQDEGIRQVHLYIAGSGPADYLASLQQLVRRYDISDLVTFCGRLPRAQIPAWMARCHVLLLPTVHQEPFARVVLEAMASGLAVIGTLTGGTGEILQHEVTGLAVAPEDSRDLARQIKRLLVEPDLRRRLALRGQELVLRNYALERMVDNVEEFLQEARTQQTASAPQGPGWKS
jgi:glycosyltransferase involved in cell wall biosynthesis